MNFSITAQRSFTLLMCLGRTSRYLATIKKHVVKLKLDLFAEPMAGWLIQTCSIHYTQTTHRLVWLPKSCTANTISFP